MRIYVPHSDNIDYKNDLYKPIKDSYLNEEHTFILPKEVLGVDFNSSDFICYGCDLIIADISENQNGIGMKLSCAYVYGLPIFFICKKGSPITNSVDGIPCNLTEYSNPDELILGLEKIIQEMSIQK